MPYAQGRYRSLACLTSVPTGPRPQEGWPVLLFLHGIGERAPAPEEIASEVVRDHPGNLRRMYLTGFSLGANGILRIAPGEHAVWAAVWLVDPTLAPPGKIEGPIWVSAGERARKHRAALVTTLALQELGPGGPADRVYEDAGLDHVKTADRAYGNSAIYTWLLRHERREE